MLTQENCFLLSVLAQLTQDRAASDLLNHRLTKYQRFHFASGVTITYKADREHDRYNRSMVTVHRMVSEKGKQEICLNQVIDISEIGFVNQILEAGNREILEHILKRL